MSSSVFTDIDKLSSRYIPSRLLHRERQMEMLDRLFDSFIKSPKTSFQLIVQVTGEVGSGKTCLTHRFGSSFVEKAGRHGIPVRFVYVNCKTEAGSRFVLYRSVLEKAAPEIVTRGMSPEEMLKQLLAYLEMRDLYMLLAVDEIDYAVKTLQDKQGSIIYDLSRLNEQNLGRPQKVIGIVFIARDTSFHSLLSQSDRSSLGRLVVDLPPYDAYQLSDILRDRASMSLRKGAIDDDVLEYICDTSASEPFRGDCRFALDTLLYAGMAADSDGSPQIQTEHVRKATRDSYPRIDRWALTQLEPHELATLMAIIRGLKQKNTPYMAMEEINKSYRLLCEEENHPPKTESEVAGYVRDLSTRGMIRWSSIKGAGISGATLEELDRDLTDIRREM